MCVAGYLGGLNIRRYVMYEMKARDNGREKTGKDVVRCTAVVIKK